MSVAYEGYLIRHRGAVAQAYRWIEENIPQVLAELDKNIDWDVTYSHDASKNSKEEYAAYDNYFYGTDKSYAAKMAFDYAWLHHIHNNPHHWQYWVLINDDAKDGPVALKMPFEYVIEMICDWWSFSIRSGDLREIFSWYDAHKDNMIMHDRTREQVEWILSEIDKKLTSIEEEVKEAVDAMVEEEKEGE